MKQVNGEQAQRPSCSEAMSRLIDGELDAGGCRELFERLGADDEARHTWVLLNVACDAVRSIETAALHSSDFVGRISAALAAEPVILAPGAMRDRRGVMRRVVLPAAAVAAAAAVLAVVAVPQLRGTGTESEPKLALKGESRDVATIPGSVPVEMTRSADFEAYLAAHRESAGGPVTSRAEYVTKATLKAQPR